MREGREVVERKVEVTRGERSEEGYEKVERSTWEEEGMWDKRGNEAGVVEGKGVTEGSDSGMEVEEKRKGEKGKEKKWSDGEREREETGW